MRKLLLLLLIILWLPCLAQARVMTQVTGVSWATSGSATAGTTGFAATSGLTHVGSTDVPPGSVATGYLEAAENTAASFQIDATGTAFAGAGPPTVTHDPKDYWIRFYVRLSRLSTALPTSTDTDYWLSLNSNNLRWESTYQYLYGAGGPGRHNRLSEGLSGGTEDSLFDDDGFVYNALGVNQWTEFILHIRKSGPADSAWELYQNGALVSRHTGLDLSGINFASETFAISLPTATGVKAQVAAPIETHVGSDITIRPRWELQGKTAEFVKAFLPTGLDQQKGGHWATTGSWTRDAYQTSGINPQRYRLSCSAAATLTSIDELGAAPYNEQGWFTIGLTDIYLPSDSTASVVLRDTAGSSLLTVDFSGGQVTQGGINRIPYTAAKRYSLLLHLSAAGEATATLLNLTDDYASTQTCFSAQLSGWNPQAQLGKLHLAITPGGGGTCELGSVGLFRWASLLFSDSMATSYVNSLSPNLATGDHYGGQLPMMRDQNCVPGGGYQQHENGLPRRMIVSTLARSGGTMTTFNTQNLVTGGLKWLRGCRIIGCDGCSINDIAAINSSAPDSAVDALVRQWDNLLTQVLPYNKVWVISMLPRLRQISVTGCANNGSGLCRLTVTSHGITTNDMVTVGGVLGCPYANGLFRGTSVDANTVDLQSSSFTGAYVSGGVLYAIPSSAVNTAQESAGLVMFNKRQRELLRQRQADGLITYSDLDAATPAPSALFDAVWGVHANPTGDKVAVRLAVQSERVLEAR